MRRLHNLENQGHQLTQRKGKLMGRFLILHIKPYFQVTQSTIHPWRLFLTQFIRSYFCICQCQCKSMVKASLPLKMVLPWSLSKIIIQKVLVNLMTIILICFYFLSTRGYSDCSAEKHYGASGPPDPGCVEARPCPF